MGNNKIPMWEQCKAFTLEFNSLENKERTTSMQYGERLYIGCGDGRVECYGDKKLYSFQGFELEFDYLESCDVAEKVLAIEKLDCGGPEELLAVGNERSLKIWRIRNKGPTKEVVEGRFSEEYDYTCVKECKNVHPCILNSLSLNNDKQYLLSSDYLKINLWKPEKIEGCFTIVDVKPHKYSDLMFVINSTKFSSEMNMVFGYSTSSGVIHINDLRLSSKSLEVLKIDGVDVDGIEGAVKSISDFQFVDSNLILARCLNSVTLYDMRNPKDSVFTTVLCDDTDEISSVYESDAVYTRFRISCSNGYGFTGGFQDAVHIVNLSDGSKEDLEIPCEPKNTEKKDKLKLVCSNGERFVVACEDKLFEYKHV
ncbi:Ser/Thr protein phosphatase PP2-A regulatory subunit B [Encephalitozoon intestinalis ATCC 50506]|uniref:Ser/Thr protein phosphatase PP2-A regulatory subunit B n=1 Tax=Encephalitozoon intestinalis (strain ATCC 50506) TaxID=876142 RepID=E0S7A3_ENCIT|nr:Ser/Thr protein phosphatase PP2-A regulatory subunit B [Encephalitozoon intestinalis ATCC 50506]ADM11531.1 Ser/Thr protein phosphatase PP2-A regulatory subunit B [Encephalitozoon intestinalis ATCC 50506]UTX45245.1 WD40 domain-containing protein [Encephalitozoon intestinalis]